MKPITIDSLPHYWVEHMRDGYSITDSRGTFQFFADDETMMFTFFEGCVTVLESLGIETEADELFTMEEEDDEDYYERLPLRDDLE